MAIVVGSAAPPVEAAPAGPHALVFYKVTCPTCQMAAPAFDRLAAASGGAVLGIGQDPADRLAAFGREYGTSLRAEPDLPPYPVSDAYGIEHVPTLVVVDGDGRVADIVESWDRDGANRAGATLGALLGREPITVSEPGDGLPAFRPG